MIGKVGHLSEDLQTEWPFWRLVLDLKLSITEVDKWSLNEVYRANALLDMQDDYEDAMNAYERAKAKTTEGAV